MKRFYRLLWLFIVLLPCVALAADGSSGSEISNPLNFTPPPSDLSVVFLGSIFGIVDGVLNGTGSQILGTMFGIFNAAVLSLGGIIILYTLLVSTLNTAHEGDFLGKKFSSIWVPIRCTLGIALLLPKASGWCVMQIFVMWVVVQGVGAADRVWEAALGYLQRGGVIVQPSTKAATSLTPTTPNNDIIYGAGSILAGTTCMSALQQQLTNLQINFQGQGEAGPCGVRMASLGTETICKVTVPDFLDTLNVMDATPNSEGVYTILMPYFPSSNAYSTLNGICGSLSWKQLTIDPATTTALGVSASDAQTMQNSRSIAVAQMVSNLSSIAQNIVQNDPQIQNINPQQTSSSTSSSQTKNTADWAILPFGMPANPAGAQPCSNHPSTSSNAAPTASSTGIDNPENLDAMSGSGSVDYSGACTNWISTSTDNPALLNGKELQGAVSDYNTIMKPTLNAIRNTSNVTKATKFVNEAKMNGWVMAGSYFFNLARLNQSVSNNETDTGTGLDATELGAFINDPVKFCTKSTDLCNWYTASGQYEAMNEMVPYLIAGNANSPVEFTPKPTTNFGDPKFIISGAASTSTVYGYLGNASNVVLMGTPGQVAPTFTMKFDLSAPMKPTNFPKASFRGGFFNIPGVVTTFFYNYIVRYVLNMLMSVMAPMLQQFFYMMLAPAFILIGPIFTQAVETISNPAANPILALANMGNSYINSIITTWISIAVYGAFAALIPSGVGLAIAVACAVMMPVLASWMLVMWGVGVLTAYYIPLLPYMLFTLGAFGWMVGVIEAMAAAPIVALGVTHPEGGHEVFGKGEASIMLLLNVFLRPALMILGYIAGIILSYVGVWLMNEGFVRAMNAMQANDYSWSPGSAGEAGALVGGMVMGGAASTQGSTMWTALFSFFFLILIYTTLYIEIVQKSFDLIHILPDKILRWLSGGQAESLGGEMSAGMAGKVKEGVSGAGQSMGGKLESGISPPKVPKKAGAGGGDKATAGGGAGGGGAVVSTASPPPSGGGESGGGADSKGGAADSKGGGEAPPPRDEREDM